MTVELNRGEPLFDRLLAVQIVAGAVEPRVVTLAFRVIPGNRTTGQSQSERLFHFEVTDDNDPYFLYLLDVGEQDFHLLKRDQSLLVEFNVFPSKLIELVELCFAGESSQSQSQAQALQQDTGATTQQSSYMPKLDVSTGVLSVVETNMFKQLTHISLQLRPGNDAAIKGYLASRLSLSLSTNRRLAEELLVKSSALSIVEVEKSEVAAELQEIRSHKDVEEKSIRSQHTQEVSQMQITMLSNMEQMREKYEAQLESARNNIDSLQAAAKVKAEEVLKLTTDLQHEKGHLEFRERELVRLLESADNDRDRIAQECKDIAAQKRAVDEQRGNLERDLARATARIEALTQQVQDRDEMMVKQMAVQRAGDDARKVLQDKLDMYITNGEALQEKLRESAAEMTRGNALITRLQSEVKQLREKSKAKSEVVARQEDVIQELRSKVNELERQSLFEKDATLLAKTQGEVLKKQLDEANSRIEESAKLISSNQDVIAYLNEEINKWQLGLRSGAEVTALGGGGVSGSSSASNAATYNVVSYSPDTTHAVSGDASSSAHQFDKDVYLRGIKNLGLGDSFMVGGTSGITSVGDLGLESFEYYASAEPLYAADTAAQTRHSRSNKAAKQYAWQAEDFGLDQE